MVSDTRSDKPLTDSWTVSEGWMSSLILAKLTADLLVDVLGTVLFPYSLIIQFFLFIFKANCTCVNVDLYDYNLKDA